MSMVDIGRGGRATDKVRFVISRGMAQVAGYGGVTWWGNRTKLMKALNMRKVLGPVTSKAEIDNYDTRPQTVHLV